jgi:hypothetical protein
MGPISSVVWNVAVGIFAARPQESGGKPLGILHFELKWFTGKQNPNVFITKSNSKHVTG